MKINISGASDDLIEIDGDIRRECCVHCSGVLKVNDDFLVKMFYGDYEQKSPCWMIAVQALEEDRTFEEYDIDITQSVKDYSPSLNIEYDGEVEVELIKEKLKVE